MRRTKIVATLGPATQSPAMIRSLIEAGADVIRLNQSHGDRTWHEHAFAAVREASARAGKPVAILVDLQGPKVRIGKVAGGRIELKAGSYVELVAGDRTGDARTLYTPIGQLVKDVRRGDRVLLDDGNVQLAVVSKSRRGARCRVLVGGPLSDHKGINLPGVRLHIPSVTRKDREDLEWAVRVGADYVGVSFVRSADDVRIVKRLLHRLRSGVRVVAKIEKPEALAEIEDIAVAADGLMVARGDLGVEMPLEDVPVAQGNIIAAAHRHDVPVIVATQMLQSMTDNPRPTRAEVSDVAGAIFGGTDAVMLSGETATGKFPTQAVRQMASIAERSEQFLETSDGFKPLLHQNPFYGVTDAVCHGANSAARDLSAKAVLVATNTGRTALLFSKYRFPGIIVGASNDPIAVRRMALYWGVRPAYVRHCRDRESLLNLSIAAARRRGLVSPGDTVVFITGSRLGRTGATNVLWVHRIPPERGSSKAGLVRGATPHGEILLDRNRCINCGVCVGDCPAGIFSLSGGKLTISRAALASCAGDWHCVRACPSGAISVSARKRERGGR